MALRKCPTCAALLGLMLVCSTSECSGTGGAGISPLDSEGLHKVAAIQPRVDVSGASQLQAMQIQARSPAPPQSLRQFSSGPCAASAPAQKRSASRTRQRPAPAAAPAPPFPRRSGTDCGARPNPLRQLSLLFQIHADVTVATFEKSLILSAASLPLFTHASFKMRRASARGSLAVGSVLARRSLGSCSQLALHHV